MFSKFEYTMIMLLECCEYFFLLKNFKNGVKILSKWHGIAMTFWMLFAVRIVYRSDLQ